MQTVCVIGGAGYIGTVLVPKLLALGHNVVVLDLFMYGDFLPKNNLKLFRCVGDVRNLPTVKRALRGCDTVIHLACISNDPASELDPELGKSINLDSFLPTVRAAKDVGVTRFIYTSSAAVYGVRPELEIAEDVALAPLTQYAKCKAVCEELLFNESELGFTTCVLRPASVCGYAPRQRFDLIVNTMINHALNFGKVTVHGGDQHRPNIHIDDMADAYMFVLAQPPWIIDRQVFNVGQSNYSLRELASLVIVQADILGRKDVELVFEPTNDQRSYHISSAKIKQKLDFLPWRTVSRAADDLGHAMFTGYLPNSLADSRYFNVRHMQKLQLK